MSSSAALAGTLLGTNTLQSTVDRFSSAVNQLQNTVNQLGTITTNMGSRQSNRNIPTTGNTAQQQNPIGTAFFPSMTNPFANNPVNLAPGMVTTAPTFGNLNAARQAALNQTGIPAAPYMGLPGFAMPPAAPAPGPLAGGAIVPPPAPFGAPAPGVFPVGGGGGGLGGGARPAAPTPMGRGRSIGGWGIAAGIGGFAAGSFAGAGAAQLPQQVAANLLAWQGWMSAPNNYSGYGAGNPINNYTRGLYYNAFGSDNNNLNYMAQNMQDATAGMANVMAASGSAVPWQTPLGRTILGSTAGLSFANPGLSFSQTSSLAGSLYSPQTSFRMLQLGYGAQPLKLGGGQNNMGAVIQSMMQRWFGQSSVSPQVLQANMSRVVGGNLQALGLSPQNIAAFSQAISTYNKLTSQGVSYNQATKWFTEAEHTGPQYNQAIADLGKYGINISDIQRLKDAQATKTGRAADISGSYNSALQKSVSLLNSFNQVLTTILDKTGMNKLVGFAQGFSAGGLISSVGNVIGDVGGTIGRIFGGSIPVAGGGGGSQNSAGKNSMTSSVSSQAKSAVGWAEKELGVPYLWGGEQPGIGFDCSGLMQWAYAQAGIKLPRTSEQQWAFLSNRSIPLNQVQEGDLVFTAGSDGSASDPGHVGMMISRNQLIQAPYTGANVQIVGYNAREWSHAARPTGSLKGASNLSSGLGGQGSNRMTAGQGNTGAAISGGLGGYVGGYGSSNELAALAGAISSGGNGLGLPSLLNGPAGATLGKGVSSSGGSTSTPASKAGIVSLARQIAKQYGWSNGTQWDDFVRVENAEAGWQINAVNPAGGNPSTSAYGLPQALPGSKMSSAGSDWLTNPKTQLIWMFDYIHSRWGDPAHAWANESSQHWYGSGTKSSDKGWHIVGDRGPEIVHLPEGSQVFNNAQTMNAIKANAPAQSPWSAFSALSSTPAQQSPTIINVNFAQGSIVVNGGNYPNSQGMINDLATSIGDQVSQHIQERQRLAAIAGGIK